MTDAGRPVGQWLREVRESKGLSHADVAQRLHLRPSVVTAIESGQPDQLPADIFLRGYVKSYARPLGLDERQVLEGLGTSHSQAATSVSVEHASSHDRSVELRRRVAVAAFSALVLIAASLGYWFFPTPMSEPQSTDSGIIEAPESTPLSDQANQTPADETKSSQADNPVLAPDGQESGAAEPVVGGDGVPAEMLAPQEQQVFPVVEAPLSTSRDESDSADVVSAPDLSSVSPSLLPPPLAEAQTKQAEASDDAQAVTQAVAGKGSLLIRFTGDCWLELFDGDGHKVISSLKGAGEEFRYQGNLPFRLVLGAVSNAQVEFNGTPFDFAGVRVRGNRAQFLLDAERQ